MILFNTTFCVDNRLADEFLSFLRLSYIPAAEGHGLHSALVLQMRGGADEESGTFTTALQMRAPSEATLNAFHAETLPTLYDRIAQKWGNGVAMFESTLDILHESKK